MEDIEIYGKYTKNIPGFNTLKKVMNFIKWIKNNYTNDTVKEIIKQYKMENDSDEENENDEAIYGIIDERQSKNKKHEIIVSRINDINYVTITSQRRKENKVQWENTDRIKFTISRFEKILRKVKKIENNQIKNNGI